jgi:hypothetical protein
MVNTKQKDEIKFAAFMGIDWADQTHAWALQLPTHCGVEHGDLAHTPEALGAWAAELAHRFGGQPIAVAVEQSRGALLFMLTKYPCTSVPSLSVAAVSPEKSTSLGAQRHSRDWLSVTRL